jgi:hypothetical protein
VGARQKPAWLASSLTERRLSVALKTMRCERRIFLALKTLRCERRIFLALNTLRFERVGVPRCSNTQSEAS